MGESVRASAGLGPEPAAAAAPATRPTAGLLALSVVADGRSGAPAAGQVARLAGRLELAGVWWREPPLTGPPAEDLPALLDVLGSESAPAAAGLIADARRLPAWPGISAGYGTVRGFSIRLAVCGQGPLAEPWPGGLAELRDALGGGLAWPSVTDADQPVEDGASAIFVPVRPDRDLDAAVAAAAAVAAGRPVLVEVAVSVGRTSAEARARTDGEELFAATGHPREQGLFGTLEECQAAAARLLHAGATELVCYLPRSHDLPDVLAQLRAISVGADALRPGEPPSAAPPPPAGWGGRQPGAG
ncbi:MAG: hypothetical protein ACLP8X_23860 [Streptosporangiaceae bacterium]